MRRAYAVPGAKEPGVSGSSTEGARFWIKVFIDLNVRGCYDILSAVTDGLRR
jgi:transposase-like protein